MLGFSLSKLLVLATILGAVWYGFRLIGRLDQARKRTVDTPGHGPRSAEAEPPARRQDGVLDLVQDETGAYVAKEKRDDRI